MSPRERKVLEDLRGLHAKMWRGRYDFEIGDQRERATEQHGPVSVCISDIVTLRNLINKLEMEG